MKGHSAHKITYLLLIVGGLNWLVIGLIGRDFVQLLGSPVARVVYVLVGLSALYELVKHKGCCKECEAKGGK